MDRAQMEKLTKDYQMLQDQLQSAAVQKEQFSELKEEYKEALAQVEKSTGKVYLSIGGAIVETPKDQALKDIKGKQESIEMRLGIVTKQFDDLTKREKSLRDEITGAVNGGKPQQ